MEKYAYEFQQKIFVCFVCSGFSVIDLVRDAQTRRLHALKRITCHAEKDVCDALQEAEYMNMVRHRNLVPCLAHCVRQIKKHGALISEVLIVMPYYRVSTSKQQAYLMCIGISFLLSLDGTFKINVGLGINVFNF